MAQEYISLYRQRLAQRQHRYDVTVSSGRFTPYLYPWDTLPALYLFLAAILSPRLPLRWARVLRWCAFSLIVLHGAYVVSHRRTLWFAGGYGIGLTSAWGMIMSGALLVCNDIARDFTRLETRTVKNDDQLQRRTTASSSSVHDAERVDLTRRTVGSVFATRSTKQISSSQSAAQSPATAPYKLVWQGFPYDGSLHHVLDWTVDLATSFRGVGWAHRIPPAGPLDIPTMPKSPRSRSGKDYELANGTTTISVRNLRSLQLRAVQDLLVSYLLLDLLKTTMITDPYFLGLAALEDPTPWTWLSSLNEVVPIAARVVRLSMSMAGVIVALTAIFSLNPLFFATILPRMIDISKLTNAPLLEPSLYPPMWHPLSTSVLRSGLGGLWGRFWHQMFRFGISEPSRVLIQGLGLDPRGGAARALQLVVAFGLSGSIHALGSYTSFSGVPSHPLSGPLAFFLLQGVGILLQSSLIRILQRRFPVFKSAPQTVRELSNAAFVVVWLYFTGPLLADDFARCGIWLFEPVPISPLRGLGLGPGGKDEGWWTWYQEGSRALGWWHGGQWWTSAVAIY
jgi:hypothetical protein